MILNYVLSPASCEPFIGKSCGGDLIDRVAKICLKRGGYNRLEYFRRKRNIIVECCKNACPDNHLYLYCSANPDAISENDVKVDIIV